MGYMSDFSIKAKPAAEDMDEFLNKLSGYGFDEGQLSHAKWYDYYDHMIALSINYPKSVFTLDRAGEESGDLERAYFHNGKYVSHQPNIVFPEYDESKLKYPDKKG